MQGMVDAAAYSPRSKSISWTMFITALVEGCVWQAVCNIRGCKTNMLKYESIPGEALIKFFTHCDEPKNKG